MTFRRRGCGIEPRRLPHPTLHGHALGAGLQGVGQMGREHTSQCVDGDGGSGQHLRKGGPAQSGTARVAARGKHRAVYGQVQLQQAGSLQIFDTVAGGSQQRILQAKLLRIHASRPATGWGLSCTGWRLSCTSQGQQIGTGEMQAASRSVGGKAGGLFGMATADQHAHVMALEARQGFGQQMREGVCRQVGLTQQQQTRQAPACPADHR